MKGVAVGGKTNRVACAIKHVYTTDSGKNFASGAASEKEKGFAPLGCSTSLSPSATRDRVKVSLSLSLYAQLVFRHELPRACVCVGCASDKQKQKKTVGERRFFDSYDLELGKVQAKGGCFTPWRK